ncbi:uncharacterized protein LOC121423521 [Lytechinus variegatus]|uniref:uncharacterized protein LOC121423521 n=1 Tax=Lytechinus variegatus TaxID=7654 RepID=UPI001BB110A5|nr:uncharacterized protein LOC121423521 [Lytechinus variegatus]
MESLIRDKIVDHLMENELISDSQQGFVPGRSTVTQLLQTLGDWTSLLDQGKGDQREHYNIGSTALNVVREEKDLGIIIDDDLKFHKQVSNAVNKANRVLISIRRTFQCLDSTTIPKLFKGLVRPLLEYGNVIWSPQYIADAKAVERVQKRATKVISRIKHLPYKERLKHLKLPSLEYRRKRGDMIQVYKITHEVDRLNPDHFFQLADSTTRGHRYVTAVFKYGTGMQPNSGGAGDDRCEPLVLKKEDHMTMTTAVKTRTDKGAYGMASSRLINKPTKSSYAP